MRTLLSIELERILESSGEREREVTVSVCPERRRETCPFLRSHACIDREFEALDAEEKDERR